MPRTALSHSRLDSHEGCPLRFREETLLKRVKAVRSEPLSSGSFLHHLIETYIKHLVNTQQQTDLDFGFALFDKEWPVRLSTEDFSALPEASRGATLDAWKAFLEGHVFEPDMIIEIEGQHALTFDGKPTDWYAKPDGPRPAFWRSMMDLTMTPVAGGTAHRIRDWKTGFAAWSVADAKEHPQLRRYAMHLFKLRADIEEIQVEVDFIRSGIVRTAVFTREEALAEWDAIVAKSDALEKAIAANDFPARPGPKCSDCPIFPSCPARAQAEEVRGIQNQSQAQMVIGRKILLAEELKRIDGMLKSYTDLAGPVAYNGQVYGPGVTYDRSWDLPALSGWAIASGIAVKDVTRAITKTELEKVIRSKTKDKNERERLMQEALALATIVPSTEYKLRKIHPDS